MEIYSNEPKLDQKLVASPIATDKEDSVIVKDHEQSVVIHGNTTTTTIKISDTQFNQPMQKEPISTATIHDATDNHYIILKDDNDSITEAQSIILKDENNNVNLDTDNENASAPEVKKKRGRPKREGPALTPQQKEERKRKKIADAIIELMQMEDIELYNDEEGDEKVDLNGALLGGREYSVKASILPRHPTKLYMSTMDVSRSLGFRDSIHAMDSDKEWLFKNNWIHQQMKLRPIAILTARSVFRHFGHLVIKDGIPGKDDYTSESKSGFNYKAYKQTLQPVIEEVKPTNIITPMVYDFDVQKSYYNAMGMPKTKYLVTPTWSVEENAPHMISIESNSTLMRAAASSAEFNSRLLALRQSTYYDFHTNLDMVPRLQQPSSINVEIVGKDKRIIQSGNPGLDCTYPLTLLPGQKKDTISLFGEKDAEKGRIALAAMEKKNAQYRSLIQSQREVVHEEEEVVDLLAPIKDTFNLNDYLSYVCAEATKTGGICKRPVVEPGEKCSHHEPIKMGECVSCNSIEAPETQETEEPRHPIPNTLMITCSHCKQRTHPECVELSEIVTIQKVQRYEWHCPQCKLCSKCNEAGDEAKLMFCDACDRGYHTYCLTSKLSDIPDGQWLCDQCAICTSCNKNNVQKKRHLSDANPVVIHWDYAIIKSDYDRVLATYMATYCESCFKQYKDDKYCPLCMHVYEDDSSDAMICCDTCDRWVHVNCDPDPNVAAVMDDPDAKFVCALCDDKKLTALILKKKMVDPGYVFKIVQCDGMKFVTPPCK